MIGATVPCPDDFTMSCGSGGTWWPMIIGALVFVGWLGYRFGRFGGTRRDR